MNNPTYQQALEWCTEWMQQNHPEMNGTYPNPIACQTWGDEFSDYYIHDDEMTGPYFEKESVEMRNRVIFRFIIPPTKDEFFTVLRILDK